MKKALIIITILTLILSFTACGASEEETSATNENTTTNENATLPLNENGQQIALDRDGVKITVVGSGEYDNVGTTVELLVENNTDGDIMVQSTDSSIGDVSIYTTFSVTLKAGEAQTQDLYFGQYDLEENEITTIEEVSLKFDVFHPETFEPILLSDEITINIPQ